MNILGISGLYHDSAAALIIDGQVVSAVQEERFTRKKNDKSFPVNAIEYCLKKNNISSGSLDCVVFYDNPLLTLDRFLENCIVVGERNDMLIKNNYKSMFSDKLWIHRTIAEFLEKRGIKCKILVCEHHISHGAYSFFESPWDEAAILTIDGVGEWATTTLGIGEKNEIRILKQLEYPHSLGLLYSAFTYFCGFKVNSGEYKLMGLAPYGEPIYYNLIKENIIDIKDDGSFRLNMEMFEFQYGAVMTGKRFENLFSCPKRESEGAYEKIYLDIAASVQKVTEDIVVRLARHLRQISGKRYLCLSGGVALNCVVNGILLRENIFDDIFINPAAGDSGSCIGAALYAYYNYFGFERIPSGKHNCVYLGPSFDEKTEKKYLDENNAVYHCFIDKHSLIREAAEQLSQQKIVGFFNGEMEFGPRALGGRSILADPRYHDMQSKLNLKIKYRESFRPFAPSVIEELAGEYFELDRPSPYMLFVAPVKKELRCAVERQADIIEEIRQVRSVIPAVTHVDYSARIQTVSKEDNSIYYELINEFYKITGCPVVVNTSFNVRGEPIVCTPSDAYECFMRTEMDVLIMDNFILYKEEQPADENRWKKSFNPD